jgi:hypothetical protein
LDKIPADDHVQQPALCTWQLVGAIVSDAETDDMHKAEAAAIAFHEQQVTDAVDIWRDGLNALLGGLDPLRSHVTVGKAEDVLLALIIRAFNSLYRAHEEALRGYYAQSLNLLRPTVEDFVAYWYVRSFPESRPLFLMQTDRTPRMRDMLEALKKKIAGELGELEADEHVQLVKDWIGELHQFSHVDRSGIALVMEHGEKRIDYTLGPTTDEHLFRYCTTQALQSVGGHLETLDNLRKFLGYPPLPDFDAWADRIEAWQRAQAPPRGIIAGSD